MLKKSMASSLGLFLVVLSITLPTQAAEPTLSNSSEQNILSHASL
ncbi:hypothetical protein FB479_10997 [Brevibacillus sp. AG162]|nr:hypothetical protein FB479_10997 [Brevibacillus sp. AG162]